MRRVFLILMIALLPVRGWAADMMGVVMAAQELSAVHGIAANGSEAQAGKPNGAEKRLNMPADCPMGATQTPDDGASNTHQGCATCQLCMALFTANTPVPIITISLPQAPEGRASTRFTSAERAPGFKPPIS